MAKPNSIELPGEDPIPILYEDRSVLAIDKPAGWVLAPPGRARPEADLQAAVEESVRCGDFWARSRGLKYVRHIHRLDAETSGVLLMVKSHGAIAMYSRLFEERKTSKLYLAVVHGSPAKSSWVCRGSIAPDASNPRRMTVSASGKEAETRFALVRSNASKGVSLLLAEPLTGRTHQIRVHAAESGCPIVADELYGGFGVAGGPRTSGLGLRAIQLSYVDPFSKKRVQIRATWADFSKQFGFDPPPSWEEIVGLQKR